MLTKEDYRDYLRQIKEVETTMRDTYKTCIDKTEDENIRKVCIKLMEDETRHAHMVEELQKLLDL